MAFSDEMAESNSSYELSRPAHVYIKEEEWYHGSGGKYLTASPRIKKKNWDRIESPKLSTTLIRGVKSASLVS